MVSHSANDANQLNYINYWNWHYPLFGQKYNNSTRMSASDKRLQSVGLMITRTDPRVEGSRASDACPCISKLLL